MKSSFYHKNETGTSDMNDYGGVHTSSGIPNHAFYRVAMALGGHAWERAGKIWYATLTDKRLQKKAKFVDLARLTVEHADILYKSDNYVVAAVQKAWQDVGVL
jgi:Zn-dependent metalloprotease